MRSNPRSSRLRGRHVALVEHKEPVGGVFFPVLGRDSIVIFSSTNLEIKPKGQRVL